MKRLTTHEQENYNQPGCNDCSDYRWRSCQESGEIDDCTQRLTWIRLLAIEDILGDEYDLDRLRELAQADREGRCVVLPCKVGDAIYMPTGIRHCKITGYEEDECDGFHIASDGVLQIKAKCWTGNHGTYGVPSKTVFLTREEAEAALREAEG